MQTIKGHSKKNDDKQRGQFRAIRTILLDAPFPVGLRSPLCLGMPARGPAPFFFKGLERGILSALTQRWGQESFERRSMR